MRDLCVIGQRNSTELFKTSARRGIRVEAAKLKTGSGESLGQRGPEQTYTNDAYVQFRRHDET